MNRLATRIRTSIVATIALFSAGTADADAVTDWNEIMEMTSAPSGPFSQSRSAAIMHLAVFEAVNAIVGDYEPYLGTVDAPPWASAEAAAVAAAHRALVALYPANAPTLDASRAASLASIPDGPAKEAGIAAGEDAAFAMLLLRADDGSGEAGMVPHTPGTGPGDWQPTPPAFVPALVPGWGQVDTFGIEDGAQFRSSPPPAIHTGIYAKDYNEVKTVGDVVTPFRPQDRTDVARFYAAVLALPVWDAAARQASAAQGKTLAENARIFALIAMAIGDGLISSFETKYHYGYWRPVTAIRAGHLDGNRKTVADPTWLPLIVTPPFPSYPSAHATASYSARAVLEHTFGKRGHDVTLTSPLVPGVVLHYTAWEQITDDIDDARIFGGIHYRFDQEAGARQGRHVGRYILRNHLRPRHGGGHTDDE